LLRRHRCAALPGGHVPLGIWVRQRAFTKQVAIGLRRRGSRKEFAVIAVKWRANRRLAHLGRLMPGDPPHHNAWQSGCAG
jgi:hypothetical protein